MTDLSSYGWNPERAAQWQQANYPAAYLPARVIADYGRKYKLALPEEEFGKLAGSQTHKLTSTDMPKVGDWVAIEKHDDDIIIHAILPRTNEIVRGHISRLQTKQVIAANVDVAFIMQPLDDDFSLERLERYIFQLRQQNVTPFILLNKSDTASDAANKQLLAQKLEVRSHVMSALHDQDISPIEDYVPTGTTAVIMGSSGAGKSTLTNRLLRRDAQQTAEIRTRDSKGRHTTVHRELFLLPGGGMIIDMPGIRELQLWGDINDLNESFPDIAAALRACKYPRCAHHTEAGCAIRDGLQNGSIDERRYKAYTTFARELTALEDYSGKIDQRRAAQSKASAKRRQNRTLRHERDKDLFEQ